jgi:uncharacterized protein GlcG (DUF336 family)
MKITTPFSSLLIATCLLLTTFVSMQPAFGQEPRPRPAPASISLGEAQTIINGAISYARERDLHMAIVVMDQSGYEVASARMDGASFRNVTFAEGKAYASALYAQTTEALGALVDTRPDRYFGITEMYPGKFYLVGGGVPLSVDGTLVGAVGIAGLPQGVDEAAARAGMADWEEYRANNGG